MAKKNWMESYRVDADKNEWAEDKDGTWLRRTKSDSEWSVGQSSLNWKLI